MHATVLPPAPHLKCNDGSLCSPNSGRDLKLYAARLRPGVQRQYTITPALVKELTSQFKIP